MIYLEQDTKNLNNLRDLLPAPYYERNYMETIVTTDLSMFGTGELDQVIDLLQAYRNSDVDFLGDGLTVNMNRHSGNVFLSDSDYNVGMLNPESGQDDIQQWFSCPECGEEGFAATDNKFDANGYCSDACEAKND